MGFYRYVPYHVESFSLAREFPNSLLRNSQDLTGKDGILTPVLKQLTEAALQAELEAHLESDEKPNRKS